MHKFSILKVQAVNSNARMLCLPDMLQKENAIEAKLLDASKTISRERVNQCELNAVPHLKLSQLIGFLFCSRSKQFNWLNIQRIQFYWNGGDLGTFSSA